ncbi:hypothetical protein R3P38DRAFT_2805597 [Favolaschia claudopus]|uniref:Uncharacterized protein n=1 Tax=Favolaschia claudopus TaxID=2862362 RepID=A0AAV9ZMU1_9AGAR
MRSKSPLSNPPIEPRLPRSSATRAELVTAASESLRRFHVALSFRRESNSSITFAGPLQQHTAMTPPRYLSNVGASSRKGGKASLLVYGSETVGRRHCQTTATPPNNESLWSERSQASRSNGTNTITHSALTALIFSSQAENLKHFNADGLRHHTPIVALSLLLWHVLDAGCITDNAVGAMSRKAVDEGKGMLTTQMFEPDHKLRCEEETAIALTNARYPESNGIHTLSTRATSSSFIELYVPHPGRPSSPPSSVIICVLKPKQTPSLRSTARCPEMNACKQGKACYPNFSHSGAGDFP